MKKLPNEFQLLLLCSSYFSEQEKFVAFQGSHEIDWTVFLSLLQRHRVLPMVCHNLNRWGIELPIKDKLKTASLEHAKKALQQTATLLEINKLFTDNGIECVHFKGASLSYYLYKDPTLRQYRDIDILIARKDIGRAYELLVKNNFHGKTALFKKSYLNTYYQQFRKDYIFQKNHCEIELHWSLLDIFNDNTNTIFFSHQKTIPFHHQMLQVFDTHHYLSYLILHGYYSGWARLHWLIDIIDFVKQHKIDWQEIKNILAMSGFEEALDEVIELLFILLSVEKPLLNQVAQKNSHNAIQLMQLPIKNSFLSRYDIIIRYRDNFLLQKGIIKKCVHFKKILATSPEDWRLLPLPKPLFFLYYPLRPLLWFIRRIR